MAVEELMQVDDGAHTSEVDDRATFPWKETSNEEMTQDAALLLSMEK